MKGWYVVPSHDEPIECKTKKEAIKIGKTYYNKGDLNVFIVPFDDEDQDGYFAHSKTIMIINL